MSCINSPEALSTNGYVLNNIPMKNLMAKNQKYLSLIKYFYLHQEF